MVKQENTTFPSPDVPPGFAPLPPPKPPTAVEPTPNENGTLIPDDSLSEQGCRRRTQRKRNQTEFYQPPTRRHTAAAHPRPRGRPMKVKPEAPPRPRGRPLKVKPEAPPRPIGRPLKVKLEAPPRRRGRPPKRRAASLFSLQEEQRIDSNSEKNIVRIISAIQEKHGDITENCSLESCYMKHLVLIGICKVVEDLQEKCLEDLDVNSLDFYYTTVRDAEGMKMNVEWLRKRLDEIKGAITLSDERNARVADMDGKKNELVQRKEELERLKAEVRDMEVQLSQESLKVEELDNKYEDYMSRIGQFQSKNLMDGLI